MCLGDPGNGLLSYTYTSTFNFCRKVKINTKNYVRHKIRCFKNGHINR